MASFTTKYDKFRKDKKVQKPELDGNSLLKLVEKDNFDTLKEYLDDHPDDKDISVGQDALTPLYWAAQHDRQKIMNMLIEKGADTNKSIKDGSTPLHNAVFKNHEKCVDILIKNGANVNVRKDYGLGGRTPLNIAIDNREVKIIQMLVKAGANLNDEYLLGVCNRCDYGNYEKCLKIAEILIKGGARINAQHSYRQTALSAALNNDRSPYLLVKLLIKNGADVDLDTLGEEGKQLSLLQVARRRADNQEIVRLIESKSLVLKLEKQKIEQEKKAKEKEERDRAKKLEQEKNKEEKERLKKDRQNLEQLEIQVKEASLQKKLAQEQLKKSKAEKKIAQLSEPKRCKHFFSDAGCKHGSSCRFSHL